MYWYIFAKILGGEWAEGEQVTVAVGTADRLPHHSGLPRGEGADSRDQRAEEADHRADRDGEPVRYQPSVWTNRWDCDLNTKNLFW